MTHDLPALPYDLDALDPHISRETLELHYGKHHAGYVKKLNAAIAADASLASKTLGDLIHTGSGRVFNLAAQIFNHTFYWNSMRPNGGGEPTGAIAKAIDASFGGFADFKSQLTQLANGHFGSGWVWVVQEESGKLGLLETHDAGNPLTDGRTPILTCDVWEHAYYVDYRNARAKYVDAWWNLVHWDFASGNLK